MRCVLHLTVFGLTQALFGTASGHLVERRLPLANDHERRDTTTSINGASVGGVIASLLAGVSTTVLETTTNAAGHTIVLTETLRINGGKTTVETTNGRTLTTVVGGTTTTLAPAAPATTTHPVTVVGGKTTVETTNGRTVTSVFGGTTSTLSGGAPTTSTHPVTVVGGKTTVETTNGRTLTTVIGGTTSTLSGNAVHTTSTRPTTSAATAFYLTTEVTGGSTFDTVIDSHTYTAVTGGSHVVKTISGTPKSSPEVTPSSTTTAAGIVVVDYTGPKVTGNQWTTTKDSKGLPSLALIDLPCATCEPVVIMNLPTPKPGVEIEIPKSPDVPELVEDCFELLGVDIAGACKNPPKNKGPPPKPSGSHPPPGSQQGTTHPTTTHPTTTHPTTTHPTTTHPTTQSTESSECTKSSARHCTKPCSYGTNSAGSTTTTSCATTLDCTTVTGCSVTAVTTTSATEGGCPVITGPTKAPDDQEQDYWLVPTVAAPTQKATGTSAGSTHSTAATTHSTAPNTHSTAPNTQQHTTSAPPSYVSCSTQNPMPAIGTPQAFCVCSGSTFEQKTDTAVHNVCAYTAPLPKSTFHPSLDTTSTASTTSRPPPTTTSAAKTTTTAPVLPTDTHIPEASQAIKCFASPDYKAFSKDDGQNVVSAMCKAGHTLGPGQTYPYVNQFVNSDGVKVYASVGWAADQTGCPPQVNFAIKGDQCTQNLNAIGYWCPTAGGGFVANSPVDGSTTGCVQFEVSAPSDQQS